MKYSIQFKPRAIKDLKGIPAIDQRRILQRVEAMGDNLQGDVKRLTDFTHAYRMRSGDWRILFEVDESEIVIYRICHRREAYQ